MPRRRPNAQVASSAQGTRQLTWWFAWAVAFCDISTSVYYVPGILHEGLTGLARRPPERGHVLVLN